MKSVFHQPGHCDLTADVDFGWLRSAMEGVGEYLYSTLNYSS